MNNRCYIGIDPGDKGFITTQFNGDFNHYALKDYDFYQLSDILSKIKEKYAENVVCVLEQVHALFGSSAKATFTFGEINGIIKGLLIANKIPYHLVPPKTWQKEMWNEKDKVYQYKHTIVKGKEVVRKEIKTKQTSFNTAQRLFPTLDLRRTTRCKNFDDNKVDSILLCEYARRKNL